ncbi:hypothetical protein BRADI_2g16683v3 [Brachypodium distachyon]|uniref:Uncharacterized protein n=1 Tax=Brachypodium distachyon TaxID=15368 RepID=A0A2K2D8W7_BRADI|nr:hypothetical protein BRADI_2g16683v3 [Brachypodium distachyon]
MFSSTQIGQNQHNQQKAQPSISKILRLETSKRTPKPTTTHKQHTMRSDFPPSLQQIGKRAGRKLHHPQTGRPTRSH